jgi:uncharacterized UPF0146 family protein
MDKRQDPKATLVVGCWTLDLLTKRMTLRSEKEVRSSDTGDGNRGTLLRTEKHSMKMTTHEVVITNAKGAWIRLNLCIRSSGTTCTKTVPSDMLDVDEKPVKPIQTSYSVGKAADLLARILGISREVAIRTILTPLPEEAEVGEISEVTPALVKA